MLKQNKFILFIVVLCTGLILFSNNVYSQDSLRELQNRVDQLQDHWLKLQNNQIDITSKLERQNQQLKQEIENLKQKLQQYGKPEETKQLEEQIGELQNKLQNLEENLQKQKTTRNNTIRELKDRNKSLQNELQRLEQRLGSLQRQQESQNSNLQEDLKKQKKQLQKHSQNLKQMIRKQQQKMQTVNQNLRKVYKQTLSEVGGMQRYSLGVSAYMSTSYYYIDRKMEDVSNLQGEDWNYSSLAGDSDNAFMNYLDLKLYGEIGEELKFQSTLSMYKLWGSWTHPLERNLADFNYSARPSNSGISVKRAYADYRPKWLNRTLNLTFGRLPTSGGHLTKYRYNRPSPSSYPDLAYNGESDGAALTLYTDKLGTPVLKSINFVYTRSVEDTDAYPFQSDPANLRDIDFYTVQLNSQLPFLDKSSLDLHLVRLDNIRPSQNERFKTKIKKATGATNVDFPEELGYLDKLTLQFDDERFLDTPLDFFASYSHVRTNPNEKQITADGNPVSGTNAPYYLTSTDNQDSQTGYAIYTGLRYNLEQEMLNNPKLGFEYNYGSEYWVGLDIAAKDPFQKLNTRGHVYEGYWIQPFIQDRLQLRTGYQHIQREYTNSLMSGIYGPPREIDETDRIFYLDLNLIF